MVRHDFHFDDLKVFISCCIPEGRFHNIIHPVDHDLPSVLRAEDHMVFAVINQVCSAIIFRHNSLRNSRFIFYIYYNITLAIWQGTDKKYTHIFRVLTKTFHCSASICILKSGSFLARIIVIKICSVSMAFGMGYSPSVSDVKSNLFKTVSEPSGSLHIMKPPV